MNKAASNQLKGSLKIVCFDSYVSNFLKIPANRVHFLVQLQRFKPAALPKKNSGKGFY